MRNLFASRTQLPWPIPINTGQYRVSTPSSGRFEPLPDTLAVAMQHSQAVLVLVLIKNGHETPCLVRNVLEDSSGAVSLGETYATTASFNEYIGPIRVAKHVSYQLFK